MQGSILYSIGLTDLVMIRNIIWIGDLLDNLNMMIKMINGYTMVMLLARKSLAI